MPRNDGGITVLRQIVTLLFLSALDLVISGEYVTVFLMRALRWLTLLLEKFHLIPLPIVYLLDLPNISPSVGILSQKYLL